MSKFIISLQNEKSLLYIDALINKKIKFIFNEDVYFGILKRVNCNIITKLCYGLMPCGFDGSITYLIEELDNKKINSFCILYHEQVSIIELQDNPNDFGFIL